MAGVHIHVLLINVWMYIFVLQINPIFNKKYLVIVSLYILVIDIWKTRLKVYNAIGGKVCFIDLVKTTSFCIIIWIYKCDQQTGLFGNSGSLTFKISAYSLSYLTTRNIFEIHMMSCPYMLDMVKNWLSTWRLKL